MTSVSKHYAKTLKQSGFDRKLTQCKVREITLSYINLHRINFETIQQRVQNIDVQTDAKITGTYRQKIVVIRLIFDESIY